MEFTPLYGLYLEPDDTVKVNIVYNNENDLYDDENANLQTIHFAEVDGEEKPELLSTKIVEQDGNAAKAVSFEQSSFSITGTVKSNIEESSTAGGNWPENSSYMMIVTKNKSDNSGASVYYAVKTDGTLVEVDVKVDSSGNPISATFEDDSYASQLDAFEWRLALGNVVKKEIKKRIITSYDETYVIDPKNTVAIDNESIVNNADIILERDESGHVYYENTSVSSNPKYYLRIGEVTNPDTNISTLMLKGSNDTQARDSEDYNSDDVAKVYFVSGFNIKKFNEDSTGDSGIDLGYPKSDKSLSYNGDGSYTLSLSTIGKAAESTNPQKIDIVVIFDTSSSMIDDEPKTRLTSAKTALETLAGVLDGSDTVRMGLYCFNNSGNTITLKDRGCDNEFTTNKDDFVSAVESINDKEHYTDIISKQKATNWEDAFLQAYNSAFSGDGWATDTNRKRYVIFISDGNPTLRNKDDKNDIPCWDGVTSDIINTYNGTGSEEYLYEYSINRCYEAAKDDAKKFVDNGIEFVGVSAFGNVSRMQNLLSYIYSGSDLGNYPSDHYYLASDGDTLLKTMQKISDEISQKYNIQNVVLTDKLTSHTGAGRLSMSNGADDNIFDDPDTTYTIDDYEVTIGGISVTEEEKKNGLNSPYFKKVDGVWTIVWDMGATYKLRAGCTYTVKIRVWPDQTAYNMVADFKNNPANFTGLTDPADKYQFVKQGDDYYLRTNTEGGAEITYHKTKEENGNPVSDEEGTKTLTNPDPIKVVPATIKIHKDWGDVPEGEYKEQKITLKLYKETSESENPLICSVELNSDNNWTSDTFYVSPGLIADPNLTDGVTENSDIQLDAGNTYYLTEDEPTSSTYTFNSENLSVVHYHGRETSDLKYTFTDNKTGKTRTETGGDFQTIVGTNSKKVVPYKIGLKKVSIEDETTILSGAKFKLYSDENGTTIAKDIDGNDIPEIESTTENEGVVIIGNLAPGTYYLKETVAPIGYEKLSDTITVTISEDGKVTYIQSNYTKNEGTAIEINNNGVYVITVADTKGKELPSTGGTGKLPFVMTGVLLIAFAGSGLMMRKKIRYHK